MSSDKPEAPVVRSQSETATESLSEENKPSCSSGHNSASASGKERSDSKSTRKRSREHSHRSSNHGSTEFNEFLSTLTDLIRANINVAVGKTANGSITDPSPATSTVGNRSDPIASTSKDADLDLAGHQPVSAKKQKLSAGFQELYDENGDYSEISDDDGHECGDNEDVDYYSSFFKAEESVGEPIRDKLATVVNQSLQTVSDVNGEVIKTLMDKYKIPSNVDNLLIPSLNPEFRELSTVRNQDYRMVFIQKLVLKCLCASLSLCQDLHTARSSRSPADLKQIYFKSLDVMSLLVTSFTNITKKRQDACKYVSDPKFKRVCAAANINGELLFGSDFQKQLREESEQRKIVPFASGILKNVRPLPPLRTMGGRVQHGRPFVRRVHPSQRAQPAFTPRGQPTVRGKTAYPSNKRRFRQ